MSVTSSAPGPYAPTAAILDIISRYRSHGLPSPISSEVLDRAGVSASLVSRTLQTLKTLDLIDDQGNPTEAFESLRLASEPEYQQRVVQWLNGAYADVLRYIDPATADEGAVRDAFRTYKPIAQQPRMVSLFLGLYASVGIGPGKPSQSKLHKRPSFPVKPRVTTANTLGNGASPKQPMGNAPNIIEALAPTEERKHKKKLPGLILALLESLPEDGEGWTLDDAADWLQTAAYNFRYAYKLPGILRVDIRPIQNPGKGEPLTGE